jgi:hypothetical protein
MERESFLGRSISSPRTPADSRLYRGRCGPPRLGGVSPELLAVEAGIRANHQSGSADHHPGMEVRFSEEEMPISSSGFAVNSETHDDNEPDNEGIFNRPAASR